MSVRYYDWIAHHSRRSPDKLALVDLASGRRFSYGELNARVSRLAGHLRGKLKVARRNSNFGTSASSLRST